MRTRKLDIGLATRPARRRTRTRMPRAAREEQMLGAARRIFARRGYQAASMDEIAAECGITKPMVYSYFDSKEGLFLACLEEGDARLRAAIRGAVDGVSAPDQRLWRGLRALFRFFEEDRDLWALGYRAGAGAPSFAEAAAKSQRAMADLLIGVFVETAVGAGVDPAAAREGEPLAIALMGAATALISWAGERPGEPGELQALRLMNFAWMGLGNLVHGDLWMPPTEEER